MNKTVKDSRNVVETKINNYSSPDYRIDKMLLSLQGFTKETFTTEVVHGFGMSS